MFRGIDSSKELRTVTRGQSWKLVKESCRCDCRLHFFSQRVINRWNSLSQDDIDAATINSFKNRLDMRRKRQMDFFKDWMSTSPLAAREWWNWWMLTAGWLCQVQPHPVSYGHSKLWWLLTCSENIAIWQKLHIYLYLINFRYRGSKQTEYIFAIYTLSNSHFG